MFICQTFKASKVSLEAKLWIDMALNLCVGDWKKYDER